MAVHEHTYGHMLQTHLRRVMYAHVIVAVQGIHLHSLVITTTVSQETRTAALLTISYMLMILFGMAKTAVQKVLAAVMEDFLHGLLCHSMLQPMIILKYEYVQTLTPAKTPQ